MKISTIPPQTPALDAVETARDVADASKTAASTGAAQAAGNPDPVAQIAAEVAAGKIGRKEAVDRILANVLDGPMLDAVPASVRADLENAIRDLIAEDPYLKSLAAAIGPSEIK